MSERIFSDFLKARGDEMDPELAAAARRFADRVEIATKVFAAYFPNAAPPPQGPDKFQAALMLIKLQTEIEHHEIKAEEARRGLARTDEDLRD